MNQTNTEYYEQMKIAREEAAQIDIASIAGALGVELIKTGNNSYREDTNKSMTIFSGNRFKDHATGEYGRTVDYVMHHTGYSFEDAVAWLVPHLMPNKDYNFSKPSPVNAKKVIEVKKAEKTPEEKMAEQVEKFEKKMQEVKWSSRIDAITDYLTVTRGLDKAIVAWAINTGLIKQDAMRNVCFIWKDADGKTVGMDKRGTIVPKDKPSFRGIQAYSLKEVGFNILKGEAKKIVFFEAAIDLLSYLTIYKGQAHLNDTLFVSMAGLTDVCVAYWTAKYPDAKRVLAVDNDDAGTEFAEKHSDIKRIKATGAKDWNEMLLNSKYLDDFIDNVPF